MSRPLAAAVLAYLSITILVPLVNGAASRPAFLGHAAWVLGIVVVASLAAWLSRRRRRASSRRAKEGRWRRRA